MSFINVTASMGRKTRGYTTRKTCQKRKANRECWLVSFEKFETDSNRIYRHDICANFLSCIQFVYPLSMNSSDAFQRSIADTNKNRLLNKFSLLENRFRTIPISKTVVLCKRSISYAFLLTEKKQSEHSEQSSSTSFYISVSESKDIIFQTNGLRLMFLGSNSRIFSTIYHRKTRIQINQFELDALSSRYVFFSNIDWIKTIVDWVLNRQWENTFKITSVRVTMYKTK